MGNFLNFSIEPDPFAWMFILVGIGLGILIYYLFTWWRMEDGLRSRRSPNQVRLEAAAAGIVLGSALPCLLSAWGFGYFLVFLVVSAIVAFWGRASWVGWLMLLIGLGLAVAAVGLKPHKVNHNRGAFQATPPSQPRSNTTLPDADAPPSSSNNTN